MAPHAPLPPARCTAPAAAVDLGVPITAAVAPRGSPAGGAEAFHGLGCPKAAKVARGAYSTSPPSVLRGPAPDSPPPSVDLEATEARATRAQATRAAPKRALTDAASASGVPRRLPPRGCTPRCPRACWSSASAPSAPACCRCCCATWQSRRSASRCSPLTTAGRRRGPRHSATASPAPSWRSRQTTSARRVPLRTRAATTNRVHQPLSSQNPRGIALLTRPRHAGAGSAGGRRRRCAQPLSRRVFRCTHRPLRRTRSALSRHGASPLEAALFCLG